MTAISPEELARQYLLWMSTHDDELYGWAESALSYHLQHDPTAAWPVIEALADFSTPEVRSLVGDGPLRTLLLYHPDVASALLVERMFQSPQLLECALGIEPDGLRYDLWLWLTEVQDAHSRNGASLSPNTGPA